MKKSISDMAALFFITAIIILSTISILGVWKVFNSDVIWKSFSTLGLLALVAVVVMVAGHFMGKQSGQESAAMAPEEPNQIFPLLRKMTLTVLIGSVSLLAFLGVLAIWEVIKDKDVLYKSLGSLAILAFGAFLMTMTCLDREGKLEKAGGNKGISAGAIVGILIIAYIIFSFLGHF